MTSTPSTLRVELATLEHVVMVGRETRRSSSYFLDFLVDDVPRSRTVGDLGLVTDLNGEWPAVYVTSAVEVLLGRRPAGDLPAGRVPLLVCGECGDLACGALTAAFEMGPAEVTWSAFSWEDGYHPARPVDSLTEPIRFDRAQYESELGEASSRVTALPPAEPRFSEPDAGARPARRRRVRLWRKDDGRS